MTRFLGLRLIRAAVTLFVVLTFVFILVRLTGDPVRLMLPDTATQADVDAMRDTLGLNAPVWEQFLLFLGGAVQGDFGNSIRQGVPAMEIVLTRMPETLKLVIPGFVVGFALAMLLAVLGEMSGSQKVRTVMLWISTVRQTIPPYLFAVILVLVLAVQWRMLPTMGNSTLAHYVIPVITIATLEIALYLRLFFQSFNETRNSDFVRTARARGASQQRIVVRHMLPNALLPVVTVAGINFGVLIGGTVVLEMIFNWPGVGRMIVQDGVLQRDFPLVQAGIVVVAVFFILINFVVDVLYALMDPRIKIGAKA